MARVTVEEVRQILDTNLTDNDILAFIETANKVVTSVLGNDTVLSDAQKSDIEKYYACHLITATRDRWAEFEKLGEASVRYPNAGKELTGLMVTPYGRIVMEIDVTGKMAKVGKRRAEVKAIKSFS